MTDFTSPTTSAPPRPIGKQRGGINVVLLSIITLGIYWLVYIFKTHSEIKKHTGIGLGGPVALIIAIFVGFLNPFLLGNDVKAARVQAGMPERVSALTGFWSWIPIIGIFIFASKLQNALNEYWTAEAATQR
ncbi:DUF4234 domain-containing protein [Jatrophihabitans sp. DSM 45814]